MDLFEQHQGTHILQVRFRFMTPPEPLEISKWSRFI